MKQLYRWIIGDWWKVKPFGRGFINYNHHRRIRMLDYSTNLEEIKEWTNQLNRGEQC